MAASTGCGDLRQANVPRRWYFRLQERSAMATKKTPASKAARPGKQHRGQPEGSSSTHDRSGSQLERERHLYPSSTVPKAGSARSNKKPKKRG